MGACDSKAKPDNRKTNNSENRQIYNKTNSLPTNPDIENLISQEFHRNLKFGMNIRTYISQMQPPLISSEDSSRLNFLLTFFNSFLRLEHRNCEVQVYGHKTQEIKEFLNNIIYLVEDEFIQIDTNQAKMTSKLYIEKIIISLEILIEAYHILLFFKNPQNLQSYDQWWEGPNILQIKDEEETDDPANVLTENFSLFYQQCKRAGQIWKYETRDRQLKHSLTSELSNNEKCVENLISEELHQILKSGIQLQKILNQIEFQSLTEVVVANEKIHQLLKRQAQNIDSKSFRKKSKPVKKFLDRFGQIFEESISITNQNLNQLKDQELPFRGLELNVQVYHIIIYYPEESDPQWWHSNLKKSRKFSDISSKGGGSEQEEENEKEEHDGQFDILLQQAEAYRNELFQDLGLSSARSTLDQPQQRQFTNQFLNNLYQNSLTKVQLNCAENINGTHPQTFNQSDLCSDATIESPFQNKNIMNKRVWASIGCYTIQGQK